MENAESEKRRNLIRRAVVALAGAVLGAAGLNRLSRADAQQPPRPPLPIPAWSLTGNANSNAATNFLGTTDNEPMVVRTNGLERVRVTEDGRVGIGTTSPDPLVRLDVMNLGPNSDAIRGVSPEASGVVGVGRFGVWGETDVGEGASGVRGESTASSGDSIGVFGISHSTEGHGVRGIAFATSGTGAIGVVGRSDSTEGTAVNGHAIATSGGTRGVSGQVWSPEGIGVEGRAFATSGGGNGVFGQSDAPNGVGVFGVAEATTGDNIGVAALSHSTNGTGVLAVADAESGFTQGVSAGSNSPDGIGVAGRASATTGGNIGVLGETKSTSGHGVRGMALATSGEAIGVIGASDSTEGTAVKGNASALTGSTKGVVGQVHSPDGVGVLAQNFGGGVALSCEGHALPTADAAYNCGDESHRWSLVRAVTVTPGDLVFENGVRATEEADGLAFVNPNGVKIAVLDAEGNLHIKGNIVHDL